MITSTNCLPNTGLGDFMGIALLAIVVLIAGAALVFARKSIHRGTTFALLGALVLGGLVLSPTSARASTECEAPAPAPTPTPTSLSIEFTGFSAGPTTLNPLGSGSVYTVCESGVNNCVIFDSTTPTGTTETLTLTTEPSTLTFYRTQDGPPATWCYVDLYPASPTADEAWNRTGKTETLSGNSNGVATVATFSNGDSVAWTEIDLCG